MLPEGPIGRPRSYGISSSKIRRLCSLVVLSMVLALAGGMPHARAAFPGAPGMIVFSGAGDRQGIFVMDADGSGQVRIARGASPAWSHDGSKIAFIDNDSPEIYVMNPDGSGRMRLTQNSAFDLSPAWSQDSTQIAFVRSGPSEDEEIWVMNRDGTGETQLTDNAVFDGAPSWSPDGSKLAFYSLRDGNAEIYVMNTNGTGVTRLTNDPGQDSQPSWSPDGTKIAFISAGSDGLNPEISVMDANGSNRLALTSGAHAGDSPAWSPDGTKIVFASTKDGGNDIYVMNADGSGISRLTTQGAYDPDWQPLHLTTAASKDAVNYRGTVTVTAHLIWFATTTNRAISLFKIPYGGTKTLVASGEVDPASGNLSATVSLTKKTAFVAEWTGDGTYLAANSPVATVNVHVITRTRLSGNYAISGRYKLYHVGSGVVQTGTVIPNHAGKYLLFVAQKRRNGSWRAVATARFRINSRGYARAVFTAAKGAYRTKNVFTGDADHLGDASPWAYFKITA